MSSGEARLGGAQGYMHQDIQAQGRGKAILLLPISGQDFQGLGTPRPHSSPGLLLRVPRLRSRTILISCRQVLKNIEPLVDEEAEISKEVSCLTKSRRVKKKGRQIQVSFLLLSMPQADSNRTLEMAPQETVCTHLRFAWVTQSLAQYSLVI